MSASIEDRLFKRTAIAVSTNASHCWEWLGHKNKDGYGRLRAKGKCIFAHRLSYIVNYGKINDGLHVLHRCDNPPCVNPSHLFLGTNADNVKDKMRKGRHYNVLKTKCKRGHVFDKDNTYIEPSTGHRQCHICRNKHFKNRRKNV